LRRMPVDPRTAKVFEVPPKVLALERVLSNLDALDGSHVWVLGILISAAGQWELQDGTRRLALYVGPELAAALPEPLWTHEGRRCAVSGALVCRSLPEPSLVVERVVTASTWGIQLDSRLQE
jgi:hypothetical protein